MASDFLIECSVIECLGKVNKIKNLFGSHFKANRLSTSLEQLLILYQITSSERKGRSRNELRWWESV